MKKTLLEITIDVLNAVDGDEVNSIADTVESLQIAKDIENVYYDIIGRKDWQFLRKLKPLDSISDSEKPTHLIMPENVSKFEMLTYNKRKDSNPARNFFTEVDYVYPDEFLVRVNQRDNTQDNYEVITDFDGATFVIRTDAHPTFYTSFDDKHVIMDAYNNKLESTLQGKNTQALLFIIPSWKTTDTFVPELPAEMFPLFVAECMTFAIAKRSDGLIQKTEQTAGRQQRHLSQTHGRVQEGVRLPNYGRTPRKQGSTNTRSKLFGPKS